MKEQDLKKLLNSRVAKKVKTEQGGHVEAFA
jgi:hypothetical protein